MRSTFIHKLSLEVAGLGFLVTLGCSSWSDSSTFTGRMEPLWNSLPLSLLFGVGFYLVMFICLYRRFGRPLKHYARHAEDMALGLFQTWDYPKQDNELDRLSQVMNSLAENHRRIQSNWRVCAFSIKRRLNDLTHWIRHTERTRPHVDAILNLLRRMDSRIMGPFGRSPHLVSRKDSGRPGAPDLIGRPIHRFAVSAQPAWDPAGEYLPATRLPRIRPEEATLGR